MIDLTPRQIVAELDKYIVGQKEAKKCVAVALRNRYRRQRLGQAIQEEIMPKNIIMIGPTGVGKTEIARRLAKLVNAPFIKVEATKFTEVGYVGRDVESMIRDLVETSIRMVKTEKMEAVKYKGEQLAEQRILDLLAPIPNRTKVQNPFNMFFGANEEPHDDLERQRQEEEDLRQKRWSLRQKLTAGELENELVEVEVEEQTMMVDGMGAGMEEMGINLQEMLGAFMPKRKKKRKMPVREARKILANEEAQKLIDMDEVISIGVNRAEQSGIVFLDEIDKIAGRDSGAQGPDVSRGGVQRDILPIVEGCTVMTKYGPVKTDYMLFIAAGAFHVTKPSDLIPELQGRFPIRVELESLTKEDFRRILQEPQNSLIKQYVALLQTDGVDILFTDDGIDALADIADKVNSRTENIGARRLHTVLEKLLEDLLFDAPENAAARVEINRNYVDERLAHVAIDDDLSRFIL